MCQYFSRRHAAHTLFVIQETPVVKRYLFLRQHDRWTVQQIVDTCFIIMEDAVLFSQVRRFIHHMREQLVLLQQMIEGIYSTTRLFSGHSAISVHRVFQANANDLGRFGLVQVHQVAGDGRQVGRPLIHQLDDG